VKAVSQRFSLTHGEEQRLMTFGVEEALLLAGDRRVLLSVRANEREHTLITTNPVELASQEAVTAPLTLNPAQGDADSDGPCSSKEKEAPAQ
ncbi:MAG TPA: hypothetical protein VFV38_40205, partial [Ktedonobacteraceae bacterium]|nr:hypothetical protein [Ktedonobacteraceae bacterium]